MSRPWHAVPCPPAVQVWKLVRVEIGLIGLSLGIGPLDAGVGILFYDPVPPEY